MIKKTPPQYLTDIPAAADAVGMRRAILAGHAIYLTMKRDDESKPEGFVFIGVREASASLLAAFRKTGPRLYVFADPRTVDLRRVRFAAAADGYLHWGLKHCKTGTTVLIGGGEDSSGVTLQILIFQAGRLVEVAEKILPPSTSMHFGVDFAAVLAQQRLNHPAARFVQVGPLPHFGVQGVEYVEASSLKGLIYNKITIRNSRAHGLAAPAAVVTLGLMASAGYVYASWSGFERARQSFSSVMADPLIKASGGIDTTSLDRGNAQRSYMEQPRRQVALVAVTEAVAKGVAAVPGARIIHLAVPAPGAADKKGASVGLSVDPADRDAANTLAPNRVPDFRTQVAVPRAPGVSGLAQAQDVLGRLAAATGMSLRVAHQGLREEGDRRSFVIEGFVHKGDGK